MPPSMTRISPLNRPETIECIGIPANSKSRKIADTAVDVVEESIGTGEEVAGRSETLDEHGAVRAMRVLAHCFSGALAGGAQTF